MPLIATRGAASAQGFGEFAQTAVATYIEDVFSTYLYTGNGSTQTITNGIDLSGKGGMVWLKNRSTTYDHGLFDTSRGVGKGIRSNLSNEQFDLPSVTLTTFSSTGFSVGDNPSFNENNVGIVSWSFREQPKFFDVVTFTQSSSSVTFNHNLGSTPGCVIIKATNTSENWAVWHRSLTSTNYRLILNSTVAEQNAGASWISVSSTSCTVSTNALTQGNTYVAYLFAHNAGGFGLAGDQNVISCGSYTGTGGTTTPNQINLGFEAQWVLVKPSSGTGNWAIADTMRGMWIESDGAATFDELQPNTTAAEATNNYGPAPTATGFAVSGVGFPNASGVTYIYVAIRRGPMKTPTSGTQVYDVGLGTSSGPAFESPFPPDLAIADYKPGGISLWPSWFSRLTGDENYVRSSGTNANSKNGNGFFYQNGFGGIAFDSTFVGWLFQRSPGFMDVVCYAGTGSARTQSHNLGAVPEMIIVKMRNAAGEDWYVYTASQGNTKYLSLNTTAAVVSGSTYWNSTTPTSSVFSLGSSAAVNGSTYTYISCLFATVAGVSKVGSYTGTGATLQVNCGFTAGSRFVMIKRTDDTGSWYVWDSARGIVAGNDPYLLMNNTAAEITNTDYIDTYSAGFEITSTAPSEINANGGTYIFLAIA